MLKQIKLYVYFHSQINQFIYELNTAANEFILYFGKRFGSKWKKYK